MVWPAGSWHQTLVALPAARKVPPVHMIRLTEERQTVPYVWVHPDEER
jgi:hypothetical protein